MANTELGRRHGRTMTKKTMGKKPGLPDCSSSPSWNPVPSDLVPEFWIYFPLPTWRFFPRRWWMRWPCASAPMPYNCARLELSVLIFIAGLKRRSAKIAF
jgi:hypothetical protein